MIVIRFMVQHRATKMFALKHRGQSLQWTSALLSASMYETRNGAEKLIDSYSLDHMCDVVEYQITFTILNLFNSIGETHDESKRNLPGNL